MSSKPGGICNSINGYYGISLGSISIDLFPFSFIILQVFALIVFSCIIGEGYTSSTKQPELFCIFNHSEDACRYGIGIGVVAFLACVFFFMVDIYFPQISSATDRKYLVMADLAFSGMFLGDVNSNRSLGRTAEFCPYSFFSSRLGTAFPLLAPIPLCMNIIVQIFWNDAL